MTAIDFVRASSQDDTYKVVVPYHPFRKGTISLNRNKIRHMSYPCSGCPLYTRAEASAILARFHERNPLPDGDAMSPWAEGQHERFTHLFDPYRPEEFQPCA